MGRSHNLIETLMGAVVLLVAGAFLVFAYNATNVRTVGGYEVVARFDRVDGLARGADVKMSGIKIGSVVDQRLDPEKFLAIVRMSIDPAIKLPIDTVAQVASEGLLGGSFVALVPGGDDKIIPAGGEIRFTQAPVNLVQLLGKFMFGQGEKEGGGATPK
jgi:phospholipid/cholesterol/gamma-HCH transport system substrate-binding protein